MSHPNPNSNLNPNPNQAWAAPSLAGCPPSARSFHSAVSLTSRAGAPLAAVFGGLDAASTHVRPRNPQHTYP